MKLEYDKANDQIKMNFKNTITLSKNDVAISIKWSDDFTPFLLQNAYIYMCKGISMIDKIKVLYICFKFIFLKGGES